MMTTRERLLYIGFVVCVAAITVAIVLAVGGVMGVFTGLGFLLCVPLLRATFFGAAVVLPTYLAETYLSRRLDIRVREVLGNVSGFIIPRGFWRMVQHPAEYRSILLASEDDEKQFPRLLQQTSGLRLAEHGLADVAFLKIVMRHREPRAVLNEAVRLAEIHGSPEVIRYAGHPSGPAQGFEFLREGIPYEFAVTMV